MNKVVIFGIDGASPKLIEQWQDELPNLKRIMEDGVYGELESTMPPITCPAWPSMFTGRNPGKLGMYNFISVETGEEYRITVNSSLDYHRWSLWKILNAHGIAVGLLNVPMTFPPHKIDSFMVCGPPSPLNARAVYTYPARLKRELTRAAPGYEPYPPISIAIPGKEEQYKAIFQQEVHNRAKAARYVMKAFPWQLLVSVFTAVDTAQHYFWHHMDDTHPKHNGERYHDVIKDLYKTVDASIGELMEELPAETNVLIVSDHGFGPCHGSLILGKWLEKEGFLTFLPPVGHGIKTSWLWRTRDFLLSRLNPRVVHLIARTIPESLSMKLSPSAKLGYAATQLFHDIDWAQTKAYPQVYWGMIHINLKGREPMGIVEPGQEYNEVVADIVDKLKKITDPKTGEPLDIAVFKGNDIYHGDYADLGPDVVFGIDKYTPVPNGERESEWAKYALSGQHARQGIFMACGPDIKTSDENLANLKIHDITPTVLHLFGLPLPTDVDGRVLSEIFEPSSDPGRRPVAYEMAGEKDRVKGKIRKLKDSGTI